MQATQFPEVQIGVGLAQLVLDVQATQTCVDVLQTGLGAEHWALLVQGDAASAGVGATIEITAGITKAVLAVAAAAPEKNRRMKPRRLLPFRTFLSDAGLSGAGA